MKKFLVAGITVLALSGPAFAGSCPELMTKIDTALTTATVSDADKARVMELRNDGEEQHGAGQHAESTASLNEALA